MKKREITASFTYTANMGVKTFESAKITLGLTRDLEPDENFEDALVGDLKDLQEMVMEQVDKIAPTDKDDVPY
jgi:hypothetical protein